MVVPPILSCKQPSHTARLMAALGKNINHINMSKVIFLHGTSSSGKSTLAKELKSKAPIPFWHFSSDQLVEAGVLPEAKNDGGAFDWSINRPLFFKAFHGCIESILDSGNNIILDHIIECNEWYVELQHILKKHDLFFVGVYSPMELLQSREKARQDQHIGNRYIGEAEYQLKHVHSFSEYDFELDTSKHSNEKNAELILKAWQNRATSKFCK